MKKKEITECPHCGSNNGVYRRIYMSGESQYNYDFEGNVGDNTHLHDGIMYKESKTYYCEDCDKPMPRRFLK